MGIPINPSMDVALFEWQHSGSMISNNKGTNATWAKAQFLNPDGLLYLVPPKNQPFSVCRYLDFASLGAMPKGLSYLMAKKLTVALKIVDPRITDVRISKIENGLSVILNGDKETTLGTLGSGAVTWASTLIAIFELIEQFKIDPNVNVPVIILIDEIGAGVHYSVMNNLWKYLRDFMATYPNIQFVATSHSDDCVKAFCETFASAESIASIVRLHKTADSEIVPTKYDVSKFSAIMSGEWEVRG